MGVSIKTVIFAFGVDLEFTASQLEKFCEAKLDVDKAWTHCGMYGNI